MRILKQILLASALVGLASVSVAHARKHDGLYLTPNAEMIFVDKKFTKGVTSVGVGGGGGLNFGYQVSDFQIELATNYQYYGGTGTVTQAITTAGAGAFGLQTGQAAAAFVGGNSVSTVDSTEHFIPITLGLNYIIPFNKSGSFSMTPGIAGGVWFHLIKRTTSTVIRSAGGGTLIPATTTTDEASELQGVVVPSIAMDYAPSDNWTFSLAGKFYLVPNGYSDNYSDTARATASPTALLLAPAYTAVNENFWYGSLHFATRYKF